MANQYFIFKKQPLIGDIFAIDDQAAAHHIFTVMRANAGEKIQVVFKEGQVGVAEVVSSDQKTARLLEILDTHTELPVHATVALGFPKGDKLEFVSEKATELGASAIWGAPFKWSVAKWDAKKLSKKKDKLDKIVLGAAEQSRRQVLPEIRFFEKLTELIAEFAQFDQVLIAYEESAKAGEQSMFAQSMSQLQAGQKILFIFGPEGGIAPEEIALFEQAGAKLIGLGPRIMRAETAPLYALSALSTYFDLLK
ncbi:16S rRNA (uracil(1498)-N(3))-methyltransferase [Lactococcus garvieae]|jgi:16S rRNA (uracil1498-N3)-methyltransferase|uniref:16S rRNA (uracil(1498)-N(3))-methyltransferase n=1 Tax=Lactococcus garvieae TaxID=1363 RepID=UPI0009BCF85B|nr:16S rRNA (uracil(1498)-N(3))-methyltransferase [Lactococcus garvieae]